LAALVGEGPAGGDRSPVGDLAEHGGQAAASDRPPKYQRPPKGSAVDEVERQIRALLAQFPRMPATVIAERIGWTKSLTILKDRVRELRPLFVPPDPTDRVEYDPGEVAQYDLWFRPHPIPVGGGDERILPCWR
jgi:hypothetical protein